MSGGYKYADVAVDPSVGVYDPTLACVILGSIIAQRAVEAAVEAVKRLHAEEAALAVNLHSTKAGFSPVAESVRTMLNQQKTNVLPADHSSLCRRLTAASDAVESSRTHVALQEAVLELDRLKSDISRAVTRKEADDARTGRAPIMSAYRSRYEALKRHAGSLMDGADDGGGPLGPAGAAATVKTALAAAGGSLQTSNELMISTNLDKLEEAVTAYDDAVREIVEKRERQAAYLRQAASEATAIIAGLRADPVVMRWHGATVDQLENDIATAVSQSETPAAAQQQVSLAREASARIIKEAGGAQMKADQRDYIARSISSTLFDMGFVVSEPVEEHPGHPATSSIVHAATASGKAIAVSVPVEGQVWYNVEGYVKSVEAAVGGGNAAVCDEAELVIEQMHHALADEFQINMGELKWDGKDPLRMLRAAKNVPQDGASSSAGG